MSVVARPPKHQLWKERLEEFRSRQQTVQQFCEAVGCSPVTFYYWKRKLAQPSVATTPTSVPSAFVPVVVRDAAVGSVRIRLQNGTRVVVPAGAVAALGCVLQHAQRVAS